MAIENLKKRLDSKDIIELHNGDDTAHVAKSKLTGQYLFVFNTKGLFAYKAFSTFSKKLDEYISKHNLVEREEES